MLRPSSAAALRPADPAARGATASQQHLSLPRATSAAQGMRCLSAAAAAALRPAHPAARGAMASQQRQSFPAPTTAAGGKPCLSSAAAFRAAGAAARGATEFDHFVVIDFEATCERDSRIYPQEIIEFPAVLVDAATGGLVLSFRTYVKPRHHPRLTKFCSELTGIRQDQVDGGVDLEQALTMHDAWLTAAGASKNRLAVVTWGDWDCQKMLEFECSFKGLTKPSYFNQWVNLRIPFEAAFGAGRRNLQEAVAEAGLQWNGRLHCGLDDACNTARLLAELMHRGVTISITGSLGPPPVPVHVPEPQPQQQLQPQQQPQLPPVNHNNLSLCFAGGAVAADCYCYCGVAIRRGVMATPGPMQGHCFFICGNWTPMFGPVCPFFVWAA
ncbi:ERI1 exoribonuclease 2-like isoform X1 [Panicum miliaceum]|uniref:ERI1 exoribonuclease 2-like isoform X1 n=1 Tax=Panicum miliaceum TaxID=4540 RepID=A0A3L6SL36_PANMI|nr:ERI1 exoribonuclease 2-like isoform X1 [Panicum miliaceum]